jgi:hypothetical protein
MGTRRTTTGEQTADYTLYMYIVHKFEYAWFLISYIFIEWTG